MAICAGCRVRLVELMAGDYDDEAEFARRMDAMAREHTSAQVASWFVDLFVEETGWPRARVVAFVSREAAEAVRRRLERGN